MRKYSLLVEKNKFLKSKLLLEAEATSSLIDMDKKINEAKVSQIGNVTNSETDAMIMQEEVVRDRDIALIAVTELSELARKHRIGNITIAKNRKIESIMTFERELLEASAKAEIIRTNAASKSIEIIKKLNFDR